MRQFIILMLLLLQAAVLFAQKEKGDIRKGNQLYEQQKYQEAEALYRNSVAKKEQSVEGNFNLGDALYKQKKFDQAKEQFNKIAASSGNKNVVAGAYHNLGNSLMEAKKYEESIDAYKKALLNNPKDDQTRYNLAYAQKMLQKQKDQDKKDQNKKDQNKDNKNKKDQDKNKQDKDKNDKDKKDQDKKDQDKNKQDQDKKDQDKKDQQNGQQPNKLSKDDAQRMLDALNNQEQQTQDKLKNKKLKGVKVHISKDW